MPPEPVTAAQENDQKPRSSGPSGGATPGRSGAGAVRESLRGKDFAAQEAALSPVQMKPKGDDATKTDDKKGGGKKGDKKKKGDKAKGDDKQAEPTPPMSDGDAMLAANDEDRKAEPGDAADKPADAGDKPAAPKGPPLLDPQDFKAAREQYEDAEGALNTASKTVSATELLMSTLEGAMAELRKRGEEAEAAVDAGADQLEDEKKSEWEKASVLEKGILLAGAAIDVAKGVSALSKLAKEATRGAHDLVEGGLGGAKDAASGGAAVVEMFAKPDTAMFEALQTSNDKLLKLSLALSNVHFDGEIAGVASQLVVVEGHMSTAGLKTAQAARRTAGAGATADQAAEIRGLASRVHTGVTTVEPRLTHLKGVLGAAQQTGKDALTKGSDASSLLGFLRKDPSAIGGIKSLILSPEIVGINFYGFHTEEENRHEKFMLPHYIKTVNKAAAALRVSAGSAIAKELVKRGFTPKGEKDVVEFEVGAELAYTLKGYGGIPTVSQPYASTYMIMGASAPTLHINRGEQRPEVDSDWDSYPEFTTFAKKHLPLTRIWSTASGKAYTISGPKWSKLRLAVNRMWGGHYVWLDNTRYDSNPGGDFWPGEAWSAWE